MTSAVDILVSEFTLLRREQIAPWVLFGLLLAMVFAGISGRMIVNDQRMVAIAAS